MKMLMITFYSPFLLYRLPVLYVAVIESIRKTYETPINQKYQIYQKGIILHSIQFQLVFMKPHTEDIQRYREYRYIRISVEQTIHYF